MKLKFDPYLCNNLWYVLNPRVRCAFGNVWISFVVLQFSWLNRTLYMELWCGTKNTIFGTLKVGQDNQEIANLEFKTHGSLENHIFHPTEQTGTNKR